MDREPSEHVFGGQWTQDKLGILEGYLSAYTTALKRQPFIKSYIDAFAGSGTITRRKRRVEFVLFADEGSTQKTFKGSARIAIETDPQFDRYIFIEKNPKRCCELEELKEQCEKIEIKNGDANYELLETCREYDWSINRAILFLDPYGMQVKWTTLEAIAATKSMDGWYLFNISAVNRLLKNNGNIEGKNRDLLDSIFATQDWFRSFYEEKTLKGFFEEMRYLKKTSNTRKIKDFIVKRLMTIFPFVSEHPKVFRNKKNSPLFLFCFASANPSQKAIAVAKKISAYLLQGMKDES